MFQSAIGLTRTADYFVKPIYVNSDSRDAAVRRSEVNTMLEATIALAESKGISLVAGEFKLAPLTLAPTHEPCQIPTDKMASDG